MRVLITGATGLVGQEIVKLCHEREIKVNYLTTRKSKISKDDNYQGFHWNIKAQDIDTNCFKNVDAIIHLAGASISKRWTDSYKKEIIDSRVESTRLLIHSLKGESHTVKQIVSASAIGIYPDSLTKYYDRTNEEVNSSFLGKVVSAWENEVDGFSGLDIKVSKIRIGLVLSSKGGALKEIIKPIKIGAGAAFGSGKQWQSWVHIQDLASMFLFVLENKLQGVFNGVAPNPVTNAELTKAASKVLKKPFFLPNVPKFLMKFVLGEMYIILFESQRVSSKDIEQKGFEFKFHHLQPALVDLLC
ncbi:TIGR01777 family oxidoreductase [Hyunsoonleella pacifica]|uniref:TIGR01777 family protein n=1 Tax=Hyunsoonleella pacifica TaxID=1080224 RepID=A0A4Q9FQY6_9FLAO|nr:TIGR01777 family oxidoreductase [Hyunsoonleella pacifica]TBN17764.1 TIGR01777 family protein [Hyunsoonleella pacifica]GGD09149.1 NAD-dependent epimerase [Hyunsoonleella pacifica]